MPLKTSLPEARSAANNFGRPPLNFFQRIMLASLRGVCALLRATGFRGAYFLASCVGGLLWVILPKRRSLAIASIMKHLGKDEAEARRIARASFTSNIMSFLEIVQVRDFKPDNNPRLAPEPPNFIRMQAEDRPIVAVLGHFGGWELEAGLLSCFRPGKPQLVVVRNQRSNVLNVLIHELRSVGSARSIGHRHAASEVMSTLRAGGTTAFLVDHNTSRKEAVFIPFMGEAAAVNAGPAMLALRAKALVYPIFLVRERNEDREDFMYRLEAADPLDTMLLEGSVSERVEAIARFYTKAVEDVVRQWPEQWLWMHNRWKTRP